MEHLELAHHSDQAHRAFSGADVGAFQLSLLDVDSCGRLRTTCAFCHAEVVASLFRKRGSVFETDDVEFSQGLPLLIDRPVYRDLERSRRLRLQRTAAGELYGIAFAGNEQARLRKSECSLPRIERSVGAVDLKETLTGERKIERVSGGTERTLGEIRPMPFDHRQRLGIIARGVRGNKKTVKLTIGLVPPSV